jgi:hypothetical protein
VIPVNVAGGDATCTEYVWVSEPPRPSDAVIVTAFGPTCATVGVHVTSPAFETVIPAGATDDEKVSGSPSGSLAAA